MVHSEIQAPVRFPDDGLDGLWEYLHREGNHVVVRDVGRNYAVFLALVEEASQADAPGVFSEFFELLFVVGLVIIFAKLRHFLQNLPALLIQ